MSRPRVPAPGLLVLSAISADLEADWGAVLPELTGRFGPLVHDSGPLPFTVTSYYDRELGSPLSRRLAAFDRHLPQDELSAVKLLTMDMEARLAREDGRRRINLDPGMITLERLVLATGKGFTHRIYIGQGIYADLTLIYQKGAWRTLPWTFPDYAGGEVQDHLTRMRNLYHARRMAAANGTDETW